MFRELSARSFVSFSGLALLLMVSGVWGKAHLWIHFKRFDNPGGLGDNGHCCDGRLALCFSRCDHRFTICIDYKYSRPDTLNCPYGKISTGPIMDQNSIMFGNKIGGTTNPMTFDFDSWPGRVQVKIDVWDVDDNNDDKVDFLKQDVVTTPAPNMAAAQLQRLVFRQRVSLYADVMVFCGPDSYGPTCSTSCVPKSNTLTGYTCDPSTGRKICMEGWTGNGCDVSVDDCLIRPCLNGATCLDGHLSFSCTCASGFNGRLCEIDINECISYPCQNGGTCVDQANGFKCTCLEGWTGTSCEVRDLCRSMPCQNGGECYNVNGTFVCKCGIGFAGALCEVDIDECAKMPCSNQGTCIDLKGEPGFLCTCNPGWTGSTCQTDIDECGSNPCLNSESCLDLFNDFACICQKGYSGKICDSDIDECLTNICQNGGNCTNTQPGFECTCPKEFHGSMCESDVNECLQNPCGTNATCINTIGGFDCICPADVTGTSCDSTIDNCLSHECQNEATCLDDINAYRCVCTAEWTGPHCEVYIDRCGSMPCTNGSTCTDHGPGKPISCTCPSGWVGQWCETDVDECLEQPCYNGAACNNTPGGFTCSCLTGWKGTLCHEDINECLLLVEQEMAAEGITTPSFQIPWSHPISNTSTIPEEELEEARACLHAGLCMNVDGSFLCHCLEGWSGQRCETDLDECTSDPCLNQGQCRNTLGNFTCTCLDAWSGQRCEIDADECERSPCRSPTQCINTIGGFNCICPRGWQGEDCNVDVDECSGISCPPNTACKEDNATTCNNNKDCSSGSTVNPCQNNGTCTNSLGSFQCECVTGWTGDLCEFDVDECSVRYASQTNTFGTEVNNSMSTGVSFSSDNNSTFENTIDSTDVVAYTLCKNGGLCRNTQGSFTCLCSSQWQGEFCERDVDECAADDSPCLNGGICSNRIGGFLCSCGKLWTGILCEIKVNECDKNPCVNNGSCIPKLDQVNGGVQCICLRGWRGQFCHQDLDECTLNPCLNNGTCKNLVGNFQCKCPDSESERICANVTRFDNEVSLPLYLNGSVGYEERRAIRNGLKLMLQEHGNLQKDVRVRVLVNAEPAYSTRKHLLRARTELTKMWLDIIVENTTLTDSQTVELLNRVPAYQLESYFPLPFYEGDIEDNMIDVKESKFPEALVVPWYVITLAFLGSVCLTSIIVGIIFKKRGILYISRRKSEAAILYSKDGNQGDGEAERSSTEVHTHEVEDEDGGSGLRQDRVGPRSVLSQVTLPRGITAGPRARSWVGGVTTHVEAGPHSYAERPNSTLCISEIQTMCEDPSCSDSDGLYATTMTVLEEDPGYMQAIADEPENESQKKEIECRGFENAMYMKCAPRNACAQVHEHLPPDPNRGALPSPPLEEE